MNTPPVRPTSKKVTLSILEEKIKVVYQEILKNPFVEKPTNRAIAQQLNISESNFKKIFKKMYGIAPYQVYLETKLVYAKQMLCSDLYRIEDIAHFVGYSQSAKFVKTFREKTGETPGEYAKKRKLR